MADTILMECKKCSYEADCVQGICSACDAGDYFCLCGNEICEDQLDMIGCCDECR